MPGRITYNGINQHAKVIFSLFTILADAKVNPSLFLVMLLVDKAPMVPRSNLALSYNPAPHA